MSPGRFALAVLLAAAGCGGSSPVSTPEVPEGLTPVVDTPEWPSAALAAQGLTAAPLEDLVHQIRRGDHGDITSLLVARNGRLVVEEYFGGWSGARPHTMQSVSKSVTSLLAGIAVDQGQLTADDLVIPFFPAYDPIANLDERKRALTVRDLLTMRTGLDWSEATYAGSPLQRLNECRCDWLRLLLDWPMREAPGTRFEYVSGGVILLGGVVGAATGARLDRFGDEHLFGPLLVQGASWVGGLPDGLPHAGGGLYLRPRDMAKIGQLVLDHGAWQGRQLVSSRWIEESTSRVTQNVGAFGGHSADYGSLWWILNPDDVVAAVGAQGQWIFVVPREHLVVASTARNDNALWSRAVGFLYDYVLPAAR